MAEFIVDIIAGLFAFIFVGVPVHNMLMTNVMATGLVISKLNGDIANVITWFMIGIPMLILIGATVYAFDNLVYRTG